MIFGKQFTLTLIWLFINTDYHVVRIIGLIQAFRDYRQYVCSHHTLDISEHFELHGHYLAEVFGTHLPFSLSLLPLAYTETSALGYSLIINSSRERRRAAPDVYFKNRSAHYLLCLDGEPFRNYLVCQPSIAPCMYRIRLLIAPREGQLQRSLPNQGIEGQNVKILLLSIWVINSTCLRHNGTFVSVHCVNLARPPTWAAASDSRGRVNYRATMIYLIW